MHRNNTDSKLILFQFWMFREDLTLLYKCIKAQFYGDGNEYYLNLLEQGFWSSWLDFGRFRNPPNSVFEILHMCLSMHFSAKGVHKTFIDLFFDIRIKYTLTPLAVFSFSLRKCT